MRIVPHLPDNLQRGIGGSPDRRHHNRLHARDLFFTGAELADELGDGPRFDAASQNSVEAAGTGYALQQVGASLKYLQCEDVLRVARKTLIIRFD